LPVFGSRVLELEYSLDARLPDCQFSRNPLFQRTLESPDKFNALNQTPQLTILQQRVQLTFGILQSFFAKLGCHLFKVLCSERHVCWELFPRQMIDITHSKPSKSRFR
jgi:hypothetical protein